MHLTRLVFAQSCGQINDMTDADQTLTERNYLAAMGHIILACLAFTALWGLIKYNSQSFHPFMIVFVRNVFGALALVPMMLIIGRPLWQTTRIGIHIRRATSGLIATFATFYAIAHTPLATAMSISYAAPLIATIGAVIFLGEKIRLRRISALVTGFIGVLIVLRPGYLALTPGIISGLIAAVATAFSLVAIKQLTRTDDPRAVTIFSFVLMLPPSLILALPYWQWPTWSQLPMLAAVGIAAAIGQLSSARAYRLAEMTAILPFDFIRFSGVIVLGWLVFGEKMDELTILGGIIIFVSTLYLAHRERQVARSIKTTGPPTE
jgi:drug/metabolite transporter (DMT)-like permease